MRAPIAASSGSASPVRVQRCRSYSVLPHLCRPLSLASYTSVMRKVVQRFGGRRVSWTSETDGESAYVSDPVEFALTVNLSSR